MNSAPAIAEDQAAREGSKFSGSAISCRQPSHRTRRHMPTSAAVMVRQ